MSTHEPLADRVGSPAPSGADLPARSAVVFRDVQPAVPSAPDAPALPAAASDASVASDASDAPVVADASEAAADAERSDWSVRDLLLVVGVCVLALLLVNAFVARPFVVPSASMENSLRPGDRLLANELAYDFGGHVRRGDVVVFDGTGSFLPYASEPSGLSRLLADVGLASDSGSVYVKRVIGIGGDRVTCCGADGRLKVNGVPVDESGYLYPGDVPSQVPFDVVVPAGKLWVMGDHRSDSRDSRDHLGEPGGGFVPADKVIGRADLVVFPLGRWRSVDRPAGFAVVGGTGGHGDQR